MIRTHILGFPRMGAQRELKLALERHWRGEIDAETLETTARDLRARHWALQRDAGLDLVTVGDFALYDHVANHIQLFDCEPARFGFTAQEPALARYFTLARGDAAAGSARRALEMTKWFDTNYHFLVPEFTPQTRFGLAAHCLLDEVAEAQALGHRVKPVLLGPLSFLWLGKEKVAGFDRLTLLDALLPAYRELLTRL
ncbi:MAG TPA: 5-methyltetrahydropteroyltriglutamate--homocysteine S-methyltransferase, partial [Burkholderiaceae bacterium]|nr:5-methyltetrahydropteroyltriglutamate--homocysteine S-methyltransferase [Burkholderiaceae bacterium]